MKLEGKVEMKWRPWIGAVKFLGESASGLWVGRERIEVENQEARLELRLDRNMNKGALLRMLWI